MSIWVCANCGGDNPEGMKFCGHCGSSAVAVAPPPEQDVADALRSFVAGPVADKLVEAGGRLPEERRLITALFADVPGFTSLADRLDPEQLLEVIDPVISGLSSVVGRYGPVSLGSGSHGSSRLHVRMLMLAVSSGSRLAASPTVPGSRTGRMPNC